MSAVWPPIAKSAPSASQVWTAARLATAPAAALGMARFGYSLLLPAMRVDLHWSFAQAGALNASNAAGYLLGAIVFGEATHRVGLRRPFFVGMLAVALSVLLCGLTSNYPMLLALRAITGVASAFAFIGGAALTAHAGSGLPLRRQAFLVSVYFAGGGVGVVAASLLAPVVLAGGHGSWRLGWLLLGAICIAFLPLLPRGDRFEGGTVADPSLAPAPRLSLAPMGISYALVGAGAIAFMTFVIAYLLGKGASPALAGRYWLILGLASVFGNFLWSPAYARLKGGRPLALVIAFNVLGVLVLLLSTGALAAVASASLFGLTLLASPSAVTAFVQKARPRHSWSRSLGGMTALFGLGQCAGPVLVGLVSDSAGGPLLGLAMSGAILAAASLVALFQRDPK